MLVVLRTVFPGVGRAEDGGEGECGYEVVTFVVLRVGTAGVDRVFVGLGVGRPEVVTDRESGLLAGVGILEEAEPGRDSRVSGMSGRGFLDFVIGSGGKGPVGGARGGREGRCGIVEVMVAVTDVDIALCKQRSAVCCRCPRSVPRPRTTTREEMQ